MRDDDDIEYRAYPGFPGHGGDGSWLFAFFCGLMLGIPIGGLLP